MYLLNTLRALFVLVAFLVGLGIQNAYGELMPQQGWFPLLMAALAVCLVAVEVVFQKQYLAGLVAIFFALVMGLGATFLTTQLLETFAPEEFFKKFIEPLGPMIALFLCYLTITIVFQSKDRLRFVVPYIAFSNQGRKRGGMIVDTSVLIDGRIVDLCQTSLIADDLIVPEFVLRELHALSDSAEAIKRTRGRRGLDILGKLQSNPRLILYTEDTDYPGLEAVDAKLVRLAKERDAILFTKDHNLAKVARAEGVDAILLPEVAMALKPVVTPGDVVALKILRPGENREQGVGYLEDGTMVVVEGGRSAIGQEREVEVMRLLSTPTGRIVFARLQAGESEPAPQPAPRPEAVPDPASRQA